MNKKSPAMTKVMQKNPISFSGMEGVVAGVDLANKSLHIAEMNKDDERLRMIEFVIIKRKPYQRSRAQLKLPSKEQQATFKNKRNES